MTSLSHEQRLQILKEQMMPRYEYHGYLLSHYDGDTATFLVDQGLDGWTKQTFRLYRINSPEIRGESRVAGLAAKQQLADMFDKFAIAEHEFGKVFLIRTHKRKRAQAGRRRAKKGKYGRYLVEILGIDHERVVPVNLNDRMIETGHAIEFMP